MGQRNHRNFIASIVIDYKRKRRPIREFYNDFPRPQWLDGWLVDLQAFITREDLTAHRVVSAPNGTPVSLCGAKAWRWYYVQSVPASRDEPAGELVTICDKCAELAGLNSA